MFDVKLSIKKSHGVIESDWFGLSMKMQQNAYLSDMWTIMSLQKEKKDYADLSNDAIKFKWDKDLEGIPRFVVPKKDTINLEDIANPPKEENPFLTTLEYVKRLHPYTPLITEGLTTCRLPNSERDKLKRMPKEDEVRKMIEAVLENEEVKQAQTELEKKQSCSKHKKTGKSNQQRG